MRLKLFVLAFVAAGLGACNSYHLHYEARPQPENAHLYADYTLLQDAVGFMVDTDGGRLEEIYVKKGDGTAVHPVSIAYPAFGKSAAIGPGIGIGPVGVGVGVPVGPDRAKGLTSATFSKDAIGPAPWEVHVKVVGVKEAVIPGVGGNPTVK